MIAQDEAKLREMPVESRRIYEGRVLNLRVDRVTLPDGRGCSREVVEHEPAVVILAENENGEVLLIDQFRYPVNQTVTELPAGIVERGENPADAAIRELREETGWKPAGIERVIAFYTSPGFTSEELTLFYATNLTPDKLQHDEDEFIISRFVTKSEAERMIASGEITDGKTLLGLYWWIQRAANR